MATARQVAAAHRNTATAVADALLANGLDTLFCLPGVQNDVFFAELYDYRDRLRLIHTRHEQGAAYMALGAAMATGKPAAYCVIPGPGFLNTTAALATAYACNAPVLALTSQIPQAQIGRGYGFLHELPDQLGVIRRLTKWADRIRTADDASPLINEAFRQMRSGRPRPVGLECPIDVWGQSAESENAPPADVHRPAVDRSAITRAVELLRNAKHPVIVAGGGAQHASGAVTRAAELLKCPVIAGQMGFGVVDARHPLSVNLQVGRKLWKTADVVLAIGTRLQPQQLNWGLDDDIAVIRIDIDPDEIDRFQKPAVTICADASDAVTALLEELHHTGFSRDGNGHDAVRECRAAFAAESAGLEPQFRYLRALRNAIPERGILVDEVTQMGHAARFGYPVYHPRTFISPGYQGTLGWGLATAIGVKIARPEVPVVSISGDGGFMFNVQELASMVQHRVAVVAVVFDDGGYGNVRRSQERRFGNRVHVSDLTNPDFVKLGESFGIKACTVDSPLELERTLSAALTVDEPLLIHVPVGPMPDPWQFVDQPRVRGVS